jgi:Uma2 family endonuclease
MVLHQPVTAEEFDEWVRLPENIERHFELINGEIVEKMPSQQKHTSVIMLLCGYVTMHIHQNDLPGFTTGETGGYDFGLGQRFLPDCAYVPVGKPGSVVYSQQPPILVIEVVSDPNNERELRQLRNKRESYLRAGATVWEVYPEDRLVDIFTPDGRYRTERDRLTFDGSPGLEIPLPRVFDTLEA